MWTFLLGLLYAVAMILDFRWAAEAFDDGRKGMGWLWTAFGLLMAYLLAGLLV